MKRLVEKHLGKDVTEKLAARGLHGPLAARLTREGFLKEGEDLSLHALVRSLGTRIRQKYAEQYRIFEGLEALRDLKEDE